MQDEKEHVDSDVDTDKTTQTPHNSETNLETQEIHPIWEVIKFFVLAVIIVFPIRMFVAQPFIVEGLSMDPTFNTGQYLIVDEISYRFSEPERGDVIILKYPKNPSKYFIKRVIGLPGEKIVIDGNTIRIYHEGNPIPEKLAEPYVTHEVSPDRNFKFEEIQLEDDEYFVMGDNRGASSDSRDWGPLQENFVVGRALVRLFPVASAAVNPGATNY